MAEFCRLLDDRRFEDWSALFTEQAAFHERIGRAAILERILEGSLARQPDLARKHVTVNIVIRVDGDEARAESDLLLFERVAAGAPWTLQVGRYSDHLVRGDRRWLFAERYLQFV
jgi:3-phenylpropionate/cinnamic acid dioxygenase small subunit